MEGRVRPDKVGAWSEGERKGMNYAKLGGRPW